MAAAVSDDSGKGRGSPARTQKSDAAGIGEILKSARERQGLTLEQVSRETKIPLKHLAALEQDNLAALPGPFYQRAEIRTYARVVKLDPNLVLARLEPGATPARLPDVAANPSIVHKPAARSGIHLVLIAAGVVVTAMVLRRVLPREPSVDQQTRIGRAADSARPDLAAPGDQATDATVALHRTGFGQDRPSSDGALPVDISDIAPTATRPPVAGEIDLPLAKNDLPAKNDVAAKNGLPAAPGDVPVIARPADQLTPAGVATELVVATNPAGARVTVDGIGWGVTPVTIRHLPPGSKRIRVSKDGYATAERVVSVAEGQRKTADIALASEP